MFSSEVVGPFDPYHDCDSQFLASDPELMVRDVFQQVEETFHGSVDSCCFDSSRGDPGRTSFLDRNWGPWSLCRMHPDGDDDCRHHYLCYVNPQVVFASVFGCCLVLVFLALSVFVGALFHRCP